MNANELADWIENGAPFGKYETAKQAVVMLRQQQAEIKALKSRELTDEEIIELTPFKKHPYDEFVEYEKEDLIDFAKAILRKAQEK